MLKQFSASFGSRSKAHRPFTVLANAFGASSIFFSCLKYHFSGSVGRSARLINNFCDHARKLAKLTTWFSGFSIQLDDLASYLSDLASYFKGLATRRWGLHLAF